MAPRVLEGLTNLPSVNIFEELDADLESVNLEEEEADVVAVVRRAKLLKKMAHQAAFEPKTLLLTGPFWRQHNILKNQ